MQHCVIKVLQTYGLIIHFKFKITHIENLSLQQIKQIHQHTQKCHAN